MPDHEMTICHENNQPRVYLPPGIIVGALQEQLAALWLAMDDRYQMRTFRQRHADGRQVKITGKAVQAGRCPRVWLMYDGASFWLSGHEHADYRIARYWLPGELEPADPGGWDDTDEIESIDA